jgi:hypothetical protein
MAEDPKKKKVNFKGYFNDIPAGTPTKNSFSGLFDDVETQRSFVGSRIGPVPKTQFAKITEARRDAAESKRIADEKNSFIGLAKETLNPINLAKSAFGIGKSVVTNPVETANQAALGFTSGVTLGATDWLQKKVFVDEAVKNGMDKEEAEYLSAKYLYPDDPILSGVRQGFNLAGTVAPYAAAENLVARGAAYMAPQFVSKYKTLSQVMINLGAWVPTGQLEEQIRDADAKERWTRAGVDTALAVAFPFLAKGYRAIRGKGEFSPVYEQALQTKTRINSSGGIDYDRAIKEGSVTAQQIYSDPTKKIFTPAVAQGRIDDVAMKLNMFKKGLGDEFKKGIDINNVTLKSLTDKGNAMVDAYLKIPGKKLAESGFDMTNVRTPKPTAFEKPTSVKPLEQRVDVKGMSDEPVTAVTAEVNGKPMTIGTNNVDALEGTLKGTGEMKFKIVDTNYLGTEKGVPITARHEFNPKLGEHTFYVTPYAKQDVSTIVHEFGHAVDSDLGGAINSFTKYIFSETLPKTTRAIAARESVDDLLASFATDRLISNAGAGATITRDGIGAEVRNIVNSLRGEIEALASTRQGGAVNRGPAEQFADAFAIRNTARGKQMAPTLNQFLDFSKSYGDDLNRVLEAAGVIKRSAKAQEGAGVAIKREVPGGEGGTVIIKEGGGGQSAGGKQITVEGGGGEKQVVRVVERPQTLERTPTGRQPDSPAFRSEKITTDEELEVFMNKKILSKITGKERIGKSNEEILTRSLASDLNEESFNKLLSSRFGNLSEDIVKGKRLLVDKAVKLADDLGSKEVADMSGEELKGTLTSYNQLIEMFETFAGVRTELSNSFRSLGITVSPGENDVLRSALEAIQKAIGNETDPFRIMQKAVNAQSMTVVEKYFSVWYPALLSGWKTTARNLTGNASNLALQTISSLFTSQGRKEFMPRVMAIIQANKDGLNTAKKVLKGEENIMSKYYEPTVPKEEAFKGKMAFLNNVEYVGKFLNAQDAYFSNAFREAEVAATRVGNYTYGLTDKKLIDAVNDAVGTFAAQQGTFRNAYERTVVGEVAGRTIASLKHSQLSGVQAFANFIFPFVKTIANITDRRLDFVPILNTFRTFGAKDLYIQRANRILKEADLFETIRRDALDNGMTLDLAKSHATSEVNRVREIVIDRLRNQQMGRFYMGMAVTAMGIPLAASGRITGTGPVGKNERAVLMKTGWRPNSIILPDGTALPYQNLALPISSILSLLGNINDVQKYGKEDGPLANDMVQGVHNFMRSELDQSFLSGLSNIYDTISGYTPPEQLLTDFAANAIPIPAAWTQIKDAVFPERYDAKTFNQKISAKLGSPVNIFTGEALEPKLDAFGDQIKADLVYGLTPPLLNKVSNDPVLEFMKENRVFIGKPQTATKITERDGDVRKMTQKEYTRYVKESGDAIYEDLNNHIQGGTFRGMEKSEIEKKIRSITTKIRQRVKKQIINDSQLENISNKLDSLGNQTINIEI